MKIDEMSVAFDLYYNSITSNQAPGLSEFEKSMFLTKAEKEIVKNYFSANSKGNNLGQGFDDSIKRQADFSTLMRVAECTEDTGTSIGKIDNRSIVFEYPQDVFIVVNEVLKTTDGRMIQVIPLRYDEYTRLMSKPYKRPLKNQAWKLSNYGLSDEDYSVRYVELVTNVPDVIDSYTVRYVKMPEPIILEDLDELTIDGKSEKSVECELDPMLHDDLVQRAVELAKATWTATGQDNIQVMMQTGQRSE